MKQLLVLALLLILPLVNTCLIAQIWYWSRKYLDAMSGRLSDAERASSAVWREDLKNELAEAHERNNDLVRQNLSLLNQMVEIVEPLARREKEEPS